MTHRIERLRDAIRAVGDTPMDVLTHETPPGRRTCFHCGKRRLGSMVITIGDEVFTACAPCTESILRLGEISLAP